MLLRIAFLTGILLLPALSLLAGTASFVPLFSLPALFVIPGLVFRGGAPPPERPNDDDGGDDGPPPGTPPRPPSSRLPLPDADQAPIRVRDQDRVRLIPSRRRRGAAEPGRPRVPRSRAGGESAPD